MQHVHRDSLPNRDATKEVVLPNAVAALEEQKGSKNACGGTNDFPRDLLNVVIWPIHQVEGCHDKAHAAQQHH